MNSHPPTREDAFLLLKEYNANDSLIKHALAVEGAMRYMARKHNEDEDKWGILGLIHDLDYERFPDQHCIKTKEILEENGWPEEYIRAVVSHWGSICLKSSIKNPIFIPAPPAASIRVGLRARHQNFEHPAHENRLKNPHDKALGLHLPAKQLGGMCWQFQL